MAEYHYVFVWGRRKFSGSIEKKMRFTFDLNDGWCCDLRNKLEENWKCGGRKLFSRDR